VKIKLLKKYFDDKCSLEEAREVLQWIKSSDASDYLEDDFKNIWQKIKVKPGDYVKWSDKLEKVHEKIGMEELYGSLDIESQKDEREYDGKNRHSISRHEIRNYSGSRRRTIVQYLAKGIAASVIVLLSFIAYNRFPVYEHTTPVIEKIEKNTELGQKLTFHLNDGTKVVLNAGSSLIYPSHFGDKERKLKLQGEAFFEVKKDISRPFKVITGSVVTTALGTSFNINAFPSNEKIEIALITGKVSVESATQTGKSSLLMLSPGEMAKVLKSDNSITKSLFDVDSEISWKDGLIYFKDADYDEVVSKLERWYGVNIHANKEPESKWSFSGKFEDETLENLLIALQFGHNFEYEINEKEVNLKF